jgi:GGDEF domain-containing protein
VFAERQRAVEQARNLSVSDPLTGLANYRKLMDELDVEIKRYGRTGSWMGELWRIRQPPGALPSWFIHVDGKKTKRSAGALGF